jgi:hypothetical protein
MIMLDTWASLPEAAADSTPCAYAVLTAMARALSSQAPAVHSKPQPQQRLPSVPPHDACMHQVQCLHLITC